MFTVRKLQQQQHGFICAKAKRQQHGFICVKAKRQQQQQQRLNDQHQVGLKPLDAITQGEIDIDNTDVGVAA